MTRLNLGLLRSHVPNLGFPVSEVSLLGLAAWRFDLFQVASPLRFKAKDAAQKWKGHPGRSLANGTPRESLELLLDLVRECHHFGRGGVVAKKRQLLSRVAGLAGCLEQVRRQIEAHFDQEPAVVLPTNPQRQLTLCAAAKRKARGLKAADLSDRIDQLFALGPTDVDHRQSNEGPVGLIAPVIELHANRSEHSGSVGRWTGLPGNDGKHLAVHQLQEESKVLPLIVKHRHGELSTYHV